MKRYSIILLSLMTAFILYSCVNPFAPKLNNEPANGPTLANQKTIQGVFDNFRYAYIYKDTIVYGNLLTEDFTFVYRNYDQGVDISWGRDEDMMTTSRMFQAAQSLDLIWNEVIVAVGDSSVQDISRGFNMTIVFSPSDILRVDGRAEFRIVRTGQDSLWKISQWRDDSNY